MTRKATDTARANQARSDRTAAARMRREGELALLNRLLAELAMPEWYPHQ